MKRKLSLLLSLVMLLSLLSACQPPSVAESDPLPSAAESDSQSDQPTASAPMELSCMDLVIHVSSALGDAPFDSDSAEVYGNPKSNDMEQLSAYVKGAFGLDEGEWQDAYIFRATGAYAGELAVLRFADESAAKHGEDCLKDYLHSREGDFTGYAPDQARLVADAALCRRGMYVGLFICENSGLAESSFTTILESGELPDLSSLSKPDWNAEEVLDKLLDFCEAEGDDVSGAERITGSDPDKLKAMIEDTYGLRGFVWDEAAVARGVNGSVFEIAVLRFTDNQDIWKITEILSWNYLDVKEDAYAHSPEQAELLSSAIAGAPKDTGFIILAVCSKPVGVMMTAVELLGADGYSGSQRHFNGSKPVADPDPSYPSRIRFVDPGKEDMSIYDTGAILAAWEQGDPAELSKEDKAVYDAAKQILEEIIADGMTDLEKETAIYRWLVDNVDYDWRHQDVMEEAPRTAYQPYGGLVDRAAVCLGYAATFQLLMDLTGLECITVRGACFDSEEHHAWNMVRLDGNWYCVDVTWDANGREQLGDQYTVWRYFNVTSDYMAQTNHQWNYDSVPEAVTESHGQG